MKSFIEKIRAFFSTLILKINHSVEKIDEKIKPLSGYKIWKTLRIIRLLLLLLVLPIIALTLGSLIKANTSKTFNVVKMNHTVVAKEIKSNAKTQTKIGELFVSFNDKTHDNVIMGTGIEGSTNSFLITDKFTMISKSGNTFIAGNGVITDDDSNVIDIVAVAHNQGSVIDFTTYDIFVSNDTKNTEYVTITAIDNGFIDTSKFVSATWNADLLSKGWITSQVDLVITIITISIWFVVLIGAWVIERYFSKWRYYKDMEVKNG